MPYQLKYIGPEVAFTVIHRVEGWNPLEVIVFHTYQCHIIYPNSNHSAKRKVSLFGETKQPNRLKYYYTTNRVDSAEGWFDIRLLCPKAKQLNLSNVEHCQIALQEALNENSVTVRYGYPPPRFQRTDPETGAWITTEVPEQIQKGIAEHSGDGITTNNKERDNAESV